MGIKDPADNHYYLLCTALTVVAQRTGLHCDMSKVDELARGGECATLANAFLDGLEAQLRAHANASTLVAGAPSEDGVAATGAPFPDAPIEHAQDIAEADASGEASAACEPAPEPEPEPELAPAQASASPAATEGEGGSDAAATNGELEAETPPNMPPPAAEPEPERWTPPALIASAPPAGPAAPARSAVSAPAPAPRFAAPLFTRSADAIRTEGSAPVTPIARTHGDRPSLQFQGANAKQGQPYRCLLTAKPEKAHVVTRVTGPDGSFLDVDAETHEVVGTLNEAGDIKLEVHYRFDDDPATVERSSTMTLVVNPDPRLMWKDNPSDRSEPFWKEDVDSKQLEADGARLLAASRRGRSHAHKGTCRDDDFFIGTSNGWRIAVVADGAGSAKYSRRGAQLAVREAGSSLTEKLANDSGLIAAVQAVVDGSAENEEQLKRQFFSVVGYAAHAALSALDKEARESTTPAVELRDLNTTLLIAVSRTIGDHTVVGTWTVGDGAVGILSGGDRIDLGGDPDGGEFSGGTRFLGFAFVEQQEMFNRTRAFVRPGVEAIVLMTDGVSDPMFKNDRALESREAWDALLGKIRDEAQFDIGASGLEEDAQHRVLEWLNFWVTGEHDDRTLAFIW